MYTSHKLNGEKLLDPFKLTLRCTQVTLRCTQVTTLRCTQVTNLIDSFKILDLLGWSHKSYRPVQNFGFVRLKSMCYICPLFFVFDSFLNYNSGVSIYIYHFHSFTYLSFSFLYLFILFILPSKWLNTFILFIPYPSKWLNLKIVKTIEVVSDMIQFRLT